MLLKTLLLTLALSLLPYSTLACPEAVNANCLCLDQQDGVLINCTAVETTQIIQILKSSQAQIGLIKLLILQDIPIPRLSNDFFSGLFIKKLELINNGLQMIDNGAFNGMSNVLQELIITHNNISMIPVGALNGLTSLLRLDLSNNTINELKQEDALPSLPKLYDISLGYNNISSIHKSFFENVKNTLQTINLGHNALREVPASALRGFRQLMALHVHNNQLQSLPALSFMNLPVLSLLNLASNEISSIHRQAFLNVPFLRYLYLTNNKLSEILPFQFNSFESLEMIDLSNNRLATLPTDSFSNLQHLRQLYLGENRISHVERNAFTNSTIVVLILEANLIEEVTKEMFEGLQLLQQISLKDNRIKVVDPAAFNTSPGLVMVDLSKNELFDLTPNTFTSQLNMLLVDLSHNKMIRTPYSAFSKRVGTVLLQENPLVCTEKVHMLQQGSGVFIPSSEDKICSGQKSIASILGDGSIKPSDTPSEATSDAQNPEQASEPSESAFSVQNSGEVLPQERQAKMLFEQQQAEIQKQIQEMQGHQQGLQSGPGQSMHPQLGLGQGMMPIVPVNAPINAGNGMIMMTTTSEQSLKPIAIHPRPIGAEEMVDHDTEENSEDPQEPEPEEAPVPTLPKEITRRPLLSQLFASNRHQPHQPVDVDNLPTENLEASTMTSTTETSNSTGHTTVDPRNNPNIIYPFPVPFLKKAPKISQAVYQTLPPSIVVASSKEMDERVSFEPVGKNKSKSKPHEHEVMERYEEFELEDNSFDKKKIQKQGEQFPYELEESTKTPVHNKAMSTTIILVCLITVSIVMIAVFIGLCMARRRAMRMSGSISTDSTSRSAYMASVQAAQMNAIYGTGNYGTMNRSRNHGTLTRPPPSEDIYGWMYAPGTYSSYAK